MAVVFISFAHEDERVAAAVQHYLTRELKLPSDDVFLSSNLRQVIAGEVWLDRIRKELTNAKVVVVMMSRRAVQRPWVNFEAGAAWLANTPLVLACYGNMSKERLPKPYLDIQALNLLQQKHYLLRSVAGHLSIPAPSGWDQLLAADKPGDDKTPGRKVSQLVDSIYSVEGALADFEDE